MARKIDKQSKRQKVFAFLDTQADKPRADVVKQIMEDFEMNRSYAMTLYQSHRTLSKESGSLVEVFSIRDHKEGTTVDPYVFSKHVPASKAGSKSTSVNQAVVVYQAELQKRVQKAVKLADKKNKS